MNVKKLLPLLVIGGFLTAVMIGCGPAATTAPEKKDEKKGETVEAKFSKYADEKLTTKDPDKTFDKVSVKPVDKDDKEIKWDDIKDGDKISVTTDKDGKVTKVQKKG
jgi:hypothetical protein